MKLTYQKPEIWVQQIELQNMIALSMADGPANPDGEVLSRHRGARRGRNAWDDEDDDFADAEW